MFTNYKRVRLCPTRNDNKSVCSMLFRKETSWLQKRKRSHQPQDAGTGKVTQQPPILTKRVNQVNATEAKDKYKAVLEEEVVIRYVEDEAGASNAHDKCHQLETSRGN